MNFDQNASGERVALPKPSIDTGMGLERIAAVLQGVHNNYDIDLFANLIAAAEDVYGIKAEGERLASFRVIADHLRASSFLLADGVSPSNEGRGYVLRRIMRRAMRHGHALGARAPEMHRLVGALVAEMGAAYPELGRAQKAIEVELEQEETRFQKTLGRGLVLLEEATASLDEQGCLPGETAFRLYDTYGFPLDLTEDILRARGIPVDTQGFDAAMERQREGSRTAWAGSGDSAATALWLDLRDAHGVTEFLGYGTLVAHGTLLAIEESDAFSDSLTSGEARLVFDRTPFYAESGGQAGDRGEILFGGGARFIVKDVQKQAGGLHVHYGELVGGAVSLGDTAELRVDAGRRTRIMANHSATHLLHAALRSVLGEHVTQKGSLVEEDKLRFDFSHGAPLGEAELEAIEDQVNCVIRQNQAVGVKVSTPDEAIAAGALALFGEKYGDEVRVLSMGAALEVPDKAYSVELCGGTHVDRTGDIALFVITAEQGVAAGVRRIEAATGAEALGYLRGQVQVAQDVSAQLKVPLKDASARLSSLLEERRTLERELGEAKRKLALGGGGSGALEGPEEVAGVKFIGRVAEGVSGKDLRALVDEAKSQIGSGVVAFVGVNEGKAAVSVGVTTDMIERFSAVELVRLASAEVGGKGGGGRPDMAQAGGPDGDKADAAIAAVRKALAG
ncbi:MAG: alanine--tRNA ligase [Hyphomonadaceae bacterium]|nr:alanine--tRNA ligase [Hyphomonadaceae bacterium]